MRTCKLIILTLVSSYSGKVSCYAVASRNRRTCGRFRPCRATTESRVALFNETEGSNNFSVGITVDNRHDLDESFRVELGRRRQDAEYNDALDRAQRAEVDVNRLKFQLNESKAAMEESAKQVMDAESRLQALKEEYTTKIEDDKSLLNQLRYVLFLHLLIPPYKKRHFLINSLVRKRAPYCFVSSH